MYRTILAPLDGSKLSECSIRHVQTIAKGCKASKVILLTALEDRRPIFIEYGNPPEMKEIAEQRKKEVKKIQKKAEEYLGKIAIGLKNEGITVKTTVIPIPMGQGVSDVILDYVHNNKIDLIIMSTHGREGISRFAFGSTTDRVVSHSRVPVLTIAPAGCRN